LLAIFSQQNKNTNQRASEINKFAKQFDKTNLQFGSRCCCLLPLVVVVVVSILLLLLSMEWNCLCHGACDILIPFHLNKLLADRSRKIFYSVCWRLTGKSLSLSPLSLSLS